MNIDLNAQLSGHVFGFMTVFTRLGAGLMMFPGIGESFVPQRVRFMFAMALSVLMYGVLLPQIPKIPEHPADMVRFLASEVMVGVFFGVVMRLMMGIIETAGAIMAMQIGLSNAMILNPSMATQSSLTSAFLSIAALALLFVSGFEQVLFRALLDTYKIFPVGQDLPYGDMVQQVVHLMSSTFAIGVELAAPFIIIGLLLYTTLGVMQKLMTQIQLFIIMIPVQIWGGFFVFGLAVGGMLGVWLTLSDDMVARVFIR
ncbi:MAG: flagellar biosynthetic protein FliR [Proteobacteria bacterium]|jgi:flagellar biosynthetic protein FliR|nr:flagellar biosynthetic protein FliR [Alphaproteobacteria bacterium]NCC03767.1 flagellar biosynthetic protein FliR [Pseudomonadota bacterium]